MGLDVGVHILLHIYLCQEGYVVAGMSWLKITQKVMIWF